MDRCIAATGLANAEVVTARAEGWPDGIGRCHVVTARALAPLNVLLEYAAPLLRDDGVLVAWKGHRDAEEERDGHAAAARLGMAVRGGARGRSVPGGAGAPPRRRAQDRAHAGGIPAASRHGAQATAALSREPPDHDRPGRYPRPTVGTVFAIVNQKGGVGKTTTAVNVAACIAEAGWSTLLADVDPQANATLGLGLPKDLDPGIYEVLSGTAQASEAVYPTSIDRLSLLPASPDLAGANVELPRQAGSERRLRDALDTVRDDFAYVLLDCPPSLGPLTVNALVAADRVIVPVQTEYFALEGLAGLLDTLSLVQRELNPRLTVAGMLLTMHDGRTRLARDVEREVRTHFPQLVFETVIPRNVRIGEAPSYGRPVIHHDPHCSGSDAYFELAKEVAALR